MRKQARRLRPTTIVVVGLAVVIGAVVGVAAGSASGAGAPAVPGPEAPATPMDQVVGFGSNSPMVAADPTEPDFVVLANRLDAPDYGCGLQVSGNAGRDWIPAGALPTRPEGAEKCYAPEIAFDAHGILYFVFVGLAGAGNRPMGVFLATSSDRAQTFGPPHQVLGPLNFGVRMALDRSVGDHGRIHLVWLHADDVGFGGFSAPPNPIQAAHSDDGGITFSAPVQVSDPERSRVVAPAVTLGPGGALHVAYYDLGDDARDYQGLEGPVWEGTWSVVLSTSTDGGRSFSAGVDVDRGVVASQRVMLIFTMAPPALVAGPGRRVCAAWTDARYGDDDAVARCSTDGGGRWQSLRRLNDDPAGNGHRQYLPRLSVAPGGRLDAAFLDRRADFRNSRYHVFFTFSVDGGRSFAPNVRITGESSDSQVGQQYEGVSAEGQVEVGGRLGLLSRRNDAVVAWPDTRNTVEGVRTGQEVFTATVRLAARQGRPWQSAAGGAALGGLGAVLAILVLAGYLRGRRAERG